MYFCFLFNISICFLKILKRLWFLAWQVPLVEQELLTLLEHPGSPPVFGGIHVTRSVVLCVLLCSSLFVLLSFFFWPLCCLSFFDLRILITPLISSNSSWKLWNSYHFILFVCFITWNMRMLVQKVCLDVIFEVESLHMSTPAVSLLLFLHLPWKQDYGCHFWHFLHFVLVLFLQN